MPSFSLKLLSSAGVLNPWLEPGLWDQEHGHSIHDNWPVVFFLHDLVELSFLVINYRWPTYIFSVVCTFLAYCQHLLYFFWEPVQVLHSFFPQFDQQIFKRVRFAVSLHVQSLKFKKWGLVYYFGLPGFFQLRCEFNCGGIVLTQKVCFGKQNLHFLWLFGESLQIATLFNVLYCHFEVVVIEVLS